MLKRSSLPRSTTPPKKVSEKKLRAAGGKLYSTITAPKKPIRKSNPENCAKREKRRRSKHAAYMRSETRRIVDARAGQFCEAAVGSALLNRFDITVPNPLWNVSGALGWSNAAGSWWRCQNEGRHHHHRTYARYGGDELPEDMLKVCTRCHEWLDKDKPSHRRS